MIPQESNQTINETEYPSLEKYNKNSNYSNGLRQKNKEYYIKPINNQEKKIDQEEIHKPINTEKGKCKPKYNEEDGHQKNCKNKDTKAICWWYKNNKCNYGDKCWNSHHSNQRTEINKCTPIKKINEEYEKSKLMRSGDIEKNPGPSKLKKKSTHPLVLLTIFITIIAQIEKIHTRNLMTLEKISTKEINSLQTTQNMSQQEINSQKYITHVCYMLSKSHKKKSTGISIKSKLAHLVILLLLSGDILDLHPP